MCNCLLFMRRKGPSDEYPALKKGSCAFSDSHVYANLIIGFVRVCY